MVAELANTGDEILAKRWRRALVYGLFRVKIGINESYVNAALRIARKKGRDDDLAYVRSVQDDIKDLESDQDYEDLLKGTADPELVLNTLTWDRFVRGCR